jgi:hypothetical protein
VSFWAELKRRNVVRVGAVYLAAAWLVAQIGDVVAQAFAAPASRSRRCAARTWISTERTSA